MNSFQSEPFTLKLLTEFENREEASGGQFSIFNFQFSIFKIMAITYKITKVKNPKGDESPPL